MKLIIDIDEDYYKAIWENGYIYDEDNEDIAKIIKDGTPNEDYVGLVDFDEQALYKNGREQMTTKQLKEFQDSAKKISTVEELEKIREEIEEQSNRNFYENGWWTYVSSVLDNHISELKGEQIWQS